MDFCISWENPATTIYLEMKYGSDLSGRTTRNFGQHDYPADQLIRNIRVGLLECGYLSSDQLFSQPLRDFAVLVVAPKKRHPLVANYRDDQTLLESIPHAEKFTLPIRPFIGELSYQDIVQVLRQQRLRFARSEKRTIDQLIDYLGFKQSNTPDFRTPWQWEQPFRHRAIALPVLASSEL